ncbi:hypothetical protein [Methylobacterium iners]|uniref:Uncharacterized protein n=1 Tax=Methylobacterium iners TaxID=418707 RepID=A0ABQ4S375_9HYPH|nr:hypothetical protein [Methylobacterium iners]GJD97496.1 hypothetical protein OCOJLMKI_4727 [Methylobacterium iners]
MSLTRRELSHVLAEPHYSVRGLMLLGAPHEGQGREAVFSPMTLASWCEAEARRTGDREAAARWHRRALRLAAHAAQDE